jgi:hypothetical protein
VADDDASFGHVWVLDVLEFDEVLFAPEELELDVLPALDVLDDGVDEAAQACPMPSPPRTVPVARVVATTALRIFGTTSMFTSLPLDRRKETSGA